MFTNTGLRAVLKYVITTGEQSLKLFGKRGWTFSSDYSVLSVTNFPDRGLLKVLAQTENK